MGWFEKRTSAAANARKSGSIQVTLAQEDGKWKVKQEKKVLKVIPLHKHTEAVNYARNKESELNKPKES